MSKITNRKKEVYEIIAAFEIIFEKFMNSTCPQHFLFELNLNWQFVLELLYKNQEYNFTTFRVLLAFVQKKLDLIYNNTFTSIDNSAKDLCSNIQFTAYDVMANILYQIEFITNDFQTGKISYFSIDAYNNYLMFELNKTIKAYPLEKVSKEQKQKILELQEEYAKFSQEYLESSAKSR